MFLILHCSCGYHVDVADQSAVLVEPVLVLIPSMRCSGPCPLHGLCVFSLATTFNKIIKSSHRADESVKEMKWLLESINQAEPTPT